jgi:hypothetical protein
MVRPEEIIVELDRLIEEERSRLRTDPEGEDQRLLNRLAELDRQKTRAQGVALEDCWLKG